MESITLSWQRIEQWLTTHAPKILERLNSGASEEEIAQTEAALSVTLPEDFKVSYRLHNGGYSLPPWQEMLTLADMVGIWEMFKEYWDQDDNDPFSDEPAGPVQPFHWHPKWIPFLWSGYGAEYVCLDLAPGPGGQVGQVIVRPHESEAARFITKSFAALVAQGADDLVVDKYLSFGLRFEERLTEGKEARDQARRYNFEQPSPGKELLDKAPPLVWVVTEDKKLTPSMQAMESYVQVLQMEQASRTDRFRAYHNLIILHQRAVQLVAEGKSTGQPLSQASCQHIEETYRKEAERLLAAFEAEAKHMPREHWVHDDLEQDIGEVFDARRVLDFAHQLVAKDNVESAITDFWAQLDHLFSPFLDVPEPSIPGQKGCGQRGRERCRLALRCVVFSFLLMGLFRYDFPGPVSHLLDN